MRFIITIIPLLIFSILPDRAEAQTTWLWAESIDRTNSWNEPFYTPYNTVDKLLLYSEDSAAYCTDCSLANILWKGIEANKIIIYQLDKKGKISAQKTAVVKTKILARLTLEDQTTSIQDVAAISEIVIYRKPDTIHTQLSELPIEWISLQVPIEKDTFSIYFKPKECFAYLNSVECKWIHPLNHHIRLNLSDALIKRNYIINNFNFVSPNNFKTVYHYLGTYLFSIAKALRTNDTHFSSTGSLEINTDTLLIRLQAIYSTDMREDLNKGFYKSHLIEYLLKLHTENKIKGYTYNEAGYFTLMQPKDLRNHLLVETMEDGDIAIKKFPTTSLTRLHTLKTYTKISTTDRITNDWLIFGLSKELSTTFNNTYAIAFKYEDVLSVLAATNFMWYNGKNQQDSMRLDQALNKQFIEYTELNVYSIYGNNVGSLSKDLNYEVNKHDPVSVLLSAYTTTFRSDFYESQEKVLKRTQNSTVKTYQLNYSFTSQSNSVLTKNTLLIDALIDAIRTNKITVYSDEGLTQLSTSTSVLNKLDKTRFYKTGNARKDSIYISKIPVEDRFIKNSDLKEFTLSSNYTTIKKKSINQGFAFGIFIPAELNPQYETDTLCYVSFDAFVYFLQKNKAYKKLSPQFEALLNEYAIVSVEDFYDLVVYDVTDENAAVPNDLPLFVRERIHP